jgi:hypothetical protein
MEFPEKIKERFGADIFEVLWMFIEKYLGNWTSVHGIGAPFAYSQGN